MKNKMILAILIVLTMMIACYGCSGEKKTTQPKETNVPIVTNLPTEVPATLVPTTEVPVTEAPVLDEPTQEPKVEAVNPDLVLVIGSAPKDAEVIESVTNDDGTYLERLLVDSMLTLTMKGMLSESKDIEARILADYPEAAEISVKDSSDPVASYPTERATFTTGTNEDTKTHVYILIPTDTKDFTFDVSIPIDSEQENQELVEVWISTLDIFDASATN